MDPEKLEKLFTAFPWIREVKGIGTIGTPSPLSREDIERICRERLVSFLQTQEEEEEDDFLCK